MTLDVGENEYKGARWVRTDLHLHSPAVPSFAFPSGLDGRQSDEVVARYVANLEAQGIEVGAITDYQQVRKGWFERIRAAALDVGIRVYPGVELDFGGGTGGKGGLHVLAIFPFDADPEQINHTIDKLLDARPNQPLVSSEGKHRELVPGKKLVDCLQQLRRETGCLIVFPHPNDSKGIFKSFGWKEAAKILDTVYPEAIEELDEANRKRLFSTSEISKERLERIARVRFSDNHNLDEIGEKKAPDGSGRATYLKLSALEELQAIRLALRDHEILVHVGAEPVAGHTRLETVEIDGNGFLGNLRLAFSSALNVVIGGRGVGKSALLEVLRYTLDLPSYATSEYREELVRYALGSGGKASVRVQQVVRRNIVRTYRIERVRGEETRVYELDNEREHFVDLTFLDVFSEEDRPLFFGQRELYEVAQSPKLRRELLDDLVGRVALEKNREIERIQQDLRANARRLVELHEHLAEREDVEHRLTEIEHRLELFKQYGVADKLREETALTRDEQRLKRAEGMLDELLEEYRETQGRWISRLENALHDLYQAEGRQKSLLSEDAFRSIQELRDGLSSLLAQGEEQIQRARKGLAAVRRRWDEGKRKLAEELRRIRQQLGAETLDPDELVKLTGEQDELKRKQVKLKEVEKQVREKHEERRRLLQQLRDIRREAFQLRRERADEITRQITQRLKIEVVYRGQRQEYADTLISFFSGSRIPKRDLQTIASNEDIPDGMELAELARRGKEELMSRAGLGESRAQQLLNFLDQDELRWYELELLAPDDEVKVSLRVGDRWLELPKLSAGQRATAMLLILLTQEQHPLLIDQPEDDLDNRFIYEDVVKLLRGQKDRRQLIMATHNPNIPVLSHAELIVSLEAQDDRARIVGEGGMDHPRIQDQVRRIMEGGEEAFRRRAEKYGVDLGV